MTKYILNILLLLLFFPAYLVAATTTAITQYSITWSFADPVEYGQFANGDYWVIDSGHGVVITSVTNSFHPGTNWQVVDYDGSMVDCQWTASTPTPAQGWDSGLAHYSASTNINHHLPYTVTQDKSVLSAISWLSGDVGTSYNATNDRYRPKLKRMAILTVLGATPPANAMRPSYAVGQKTVYNADNINVSLLPDLPTVSLAPSMATALAWVQGPWVDLWREYTSEYGRPSENFDRMPAAGLTTYQAYTVPQYTKALLLACLDQGVIGDKTPLAIRLVQIGIDYYGLLQNGANWPANGGHQLGFKLPIMVSGLLLNNQGMLNIGTTYPPTSNTFQEDCNHFYVSQRDVDITHSAAWDADSRATLTPYEVADIGTPEWGIRGCSVPAQNNADLTATYREINASPDMGYGLAARILGLRQKWNHEPFFLYLDRWKNWGDTFSSTFERNMWTTYSSTYGGDVYVDPPSTIGGSYLPFKSNGKATRAPQ